MEDCKGASMNEYIDIAIQQGATFILPIYYKDSEGEPIDLTGYTAKMQIRQTRNAEDPALVDLTTENGGIIITADEGLVTIIISSDITAALDVLINGVYDFFLFAPEASGLVYKDLQGKATVEGRTTKWS